MLINLTHFILLFPVNQLFYYSHKRIRNIDYKSAFITK